MRVYRTLILMVVMVVTLGGFSCCPEPHPDPGPMVSATAKESKYVVITPYACEGQEECLVIPYERHMEGLDRLTFVNLTTYEVTITFSDPNAVIGGPVHTIQPDKAVTLKLKNPNVVATYEYSVDVECYDPPPAGPRIIVP